VFDKNSICVLCKVLANQRDISQQLFKINVGQQQGFASTHSKLDGALHVLSRLDAQLNNPIPRLFVLLPAERKNEWEHPRSWLRSKLVTKYHLYFICGHSYKAVSPPIKLGVSKVWINRIAPVLGISLMILQIAGKSVTGIDFRLGDAATELLELGSDKLTEMLDEVGEILQESDDHGILERLRSGNSLLEEDIQKINGDALDLVVEKARGELGWRYAMEPVKANRDSAKTKWVSKAIANDPQYRYEIID